MVRFFPSSILLLGVLGSVGYAEQAIERTGESIYREMCIQCHGDKGQGVADKHDEPIYGEKTLEALARYIDRAMPEDEADKLDAKGAAQVAEYIYNAFYSTTARARLNPQEKSAARLTVRQFQESVADVVGGLQAPKPPGAPTGLFGEYFESDGMNKKARKGLDRVDGVLEFDFKENGPAEGISAEQFSINWDGSLLTQHTGWHEFRITTPNGARLYLNTEMRRGKGNSRDDSGERGIEPTIDSWVSSGTERREALARVFLLGGRPYPLRFDYFKFKDKLGYVKLEWKQPEGQWEVLSAPYLSPESVREVLTVTTAFPPDDSSQGFERGYAVTKDWHEATTKAALEAASAVVRRMDTLADTREGEPERADKLKGLMRRMAENAFRRPLDPEQQQAYVETHFASGLSPDVAVKRSALAILKSPRFLYPELGSQVDSHTVATRLALALWDSLPDAPLRQAANQGQLLTPEQILPHAERMLADPRAKAKLTLFFHHWLAGEAVDHLDKDRTTYPEFDAHLVQDMRRSLDLFVEHVVWSERSDYRELLLADYLMLTPRLARYYGATPASETNGFAPVKFDANQRAGILTHPLILTAFSYHKSTSPIHRGVFLTRNIMGRFLKPPPMAIEFMDDRFDPSLTMREKVTQLTSKESCMGCHATINPLGFSLENYDATGRWRGMDNNKPVNAEADYVTTEGETVKLRNPRDLATHAANDRAARRGFIRQLFQFMVNQSPNVYGPQTLETLEKAFSDDGCHIRRLTARIAALAAGYGVK